MMRIACGCGVLLVALGGATFAAANGNLPAPAEDPVVQHYADVLQQLETRPDSTTALLGLRPPGPSPSAARRAALDRIVEFLAGAARKHPRSFPIAYNYHRALWSRYLFLGRKADAKQALRQLSVAMKLAPPTSEARARCHYEYAMNLLALRKTHPDHLAGLVEGNVRDAAIASLLAAKRSALSKGPYARRAVLALGDLYLAKKNLPKAREYFREAIRLDPAHGYAANRAYDRLGQILRQQGDIDGALTMLASAGKVTPDVDIRAAGYACGLACDLILKDRRYPKAVAYLEKAYRLAAREKARVRPEHLFALAYGYKEMGRTRRSLLYWKKYLELGDTDIERRRTAKRIAQSLAVSGLIRPK